MISHFLHHPFIVTARHSSNHPLKHRCRHGILAARQTVDFQRQLAIVSRRSHPRPIDPDLLPGDRDHSWLPSVSRGLPLGLMLVTPYAEPVHLVLHQQRSQLETERHTKSMQAPLHLLEHLRSIDRQLRCICRLDLPLPLRCPRSSMELLLIRFLRGGFPLFSQPERTPARKPPFQFSTTVGTRSTSSSPSGP